MLEKFSTEIQLNEVAAHLRMIEHEIAENDHVVPFPVVRLGFALVQLTTPNKALPVSHSSAELIKAHSHRHRCCP